MPNFEPCIYATKRINSKVYQKLFNRHGLPIKPIYQMVYQYGNKSILKALILFDDSFNCYQHIGFPAILIQDHNIN